MKNQNMINKIRIGLSDYLLRVALKLLGNGHSAYLLAYAIKAYLSLRKNYEGSFRSD